MQPLNMSFDRDVQKSFEDVENVSYPYVHIAYHFVWEWVCLRWVHTCLRRRFSKTQHWHTTGGTLSVTLHRTTKRAKSALVILAERVSK